MDYETTLLETHEQIFENKNVKGSKIDRKSNRETKGQTYSKT